MIYSGNLSGRTFFPGAAPQSFFLSPDIFPEIMYLKAKRKEEEDEAKRKDLLLLSCEFQGTPPNATLFARNSQPYITIVP